MASWFSRLFGGGDGDTQAAAVAPPETSKPADGPPRGDEILISRAQRISRSFVSRGLTPKRFREILDDADVGNVRDLMELLDDVQQDAKFGSNLRTRKLAVAGAPWCCLPPDGDESDAAAKIAKEAERFLGRIPQFAALKMDLLDAVYRGFAATQPAFQADAKSWFIVKHKPIESRFFRFDEDNKPRVSVDGSYEGIELPPAPSVLYHEARSTPTETISRQGIGRALAKLWIYKNLFTVDLASYLERFGHPLVQAEYPAHIRENTAELERIKDACRSFAVDMAAVVPQGTVMKLIEAVGKGATVRDVYLAAIEWCDDAAAVCILGGALTTGRSNPGIGQGREAEEHGEVRQELKELDASQLEETITTQLLRHWTAWHFGPTAPVPRLKIHVEEEEDQLHLAQVRKARAETRQILQTMGVPQSLDEIYAEQDMKPPASAKDTLEPKAAPKPTPPEGDEDDA
jgi:phage gp29-like protein